MSNIANVVLISGGKDSQATALSAIKSGAENLFFVFADTGNEEESTYSFIEYLSVELKKLTGKGIDTVKADFSEKINKKREALITHLTEMESGTEFSNKRLKEFTPEILRRMIETLKPTGNPFLDLCIWKGRFPGTKSRFCSQELKHAPTNKYQADLLNSFDAVISWQGVRRDESKERAGLPEKEIEFGSWEPEPEGMLIYRPILDWSAADCFNIIREFGMKWNPLYEQGMGRVGCMPCIHARKAEIVEIQKRFPLEIDRIAEWERAVSRAAKQGVSTFMDARITAKYLGTGITTDEIKTETHGIKTYSEYAATSRGGRQFDLITMLDISEESPQCSSVYGLCE